MTTTITSFMYDLGLEAKDPISGFSGIIVARVHHLFGCSTYGIAPREVGSDGSTKKTEYFDEARLEIVGDGVRRKGTAVFDEIFMHAAGKEARDKVTGFEGKIAYRIEYLYSCNQYGLMPTVDKEGKTRDMEQFDEGRIEVIGEGIKPEEVAAPKRGGVVNRDAPRF